MKTKEEFKKVEKLRSSEVAPCDENEPLTRLATLATLSPGERAVGHICLQNTKIVGTNSVKSLKTKDSGYFKVQKRTQNELEKTQNEHVFEHKMCELNSNSEIVPSDENEPLTRLATLATLSPRERAVDHVRLENTRIVGTNLVKSLKINDVVYYKAQKRTRNELKTTSISSTKQRIERRNRAVFAFAAMQAEKKGVAGIIGVGDDRAKDTGCTIVINSDQVALN